MRGSLIIIISFFCNFLLGQVNEVIKIQDLIDEGEIYWKESKMEEATRTYYKILNLAEIQKDTSLQCLYYVNLMLVYNRFNDNLTVEKLINQSRNICTNCKNLRNKAAWYVRLALLNFYKNEWQSALSNLDEGSKLFFMANDSVRGYGALSKKLKYYESIGKPEMVTSDMENYYKYSVLDGNPINIIRASNDLAGHYNNLGNGIKALENVAKYKNLALERNDYYHYSYALAHESKAYEILGNKNKALELYKTYISYYRDSVMFHERLSDIENYKTKYETEKKDIKIIFQEQQLKNEKTLRSYISIFFIVSTIAGGFLLFLTLKLRKRNKEKEFLIKEVHHRVKNNLQVLSSLLYLQSRHVKDGAALDALKEGQNRVDAMSLIHKKLYTGYQNSVVSMKDYLQDLGDSLLDSFGIHDQRIEIKTLVEDINLDVDKAILIGLISNELITNSLKYAFPEGRRGVIALNFHHENKKYLILEVKDNGVGVQNQDYTGKTTFGTNLVEMLASKLKGSLVIEKTNGYQVTIKFEMEMV